MKILHYLGTRTPFQQVLLTFGVFAALFIIAFLVLTAPNVFLGIGAGLLAGLVFGVILKIILDLAP